MNQEFFFGNAQWVGSPDATDRDFLILRKHFSLTDPQGARLRVLGLGFFKCYINGVCINPDTFLPLSSDYEASCDPVGERLSGHRIYVPEFDLTPYVHGGENLLVLRFGGGWYTHRNRTFGVPKAIFRITAHSGEEILSDEACRIGGDCTVDYLFTRYESQCYAEGTDGISPDLNDSHWAYATVLPPLLTEYCSTDCPADRLICELPVGEVGSGREGKIYDCGENTVGYPLLSLFAKKGEKVEVRFSEALTPDGELDPAHGHKQCFSVISDGLERQVQPEFTWFGFRYFQVIGDAAPLSVKVVHADVDVTSEFDCDNETLNWTWRTFLHTMLCNLHTGHPSDCPHIERRGYTGDGQLTCHAALSTLDARRLYEKWLQDIADSQDEISGHIQYTAPYIRSGGGPGGWGSAIVEVPYQLYRHYGDPSVLEKYYPHMRRYLDYLDTHSEFGLVTSDKEGEWCLGDWCGPIILYPELDISSHNQQILLPAPMVNTYFAAKSLRTLCEIARVIGREEDIPVYEEMLEARKGAIRAAYFNTFDGNFVMNAQGANAFAVDLGLGNDKTYQNLLRYYEKLGFYDTGIFATDILTRILFERGDGELAVDLLTTDGGQGFEHWRRNGATTFHEYWDSNRSRSHNHPMFGAPVAYFLEYLLGIGQREGTAGYRSLIIAPQAVSRFGRMSGSILTPSGRVAVAYRKEDAAIRFRIEIPRGTEALFRYGDREEALQTGVNEITLPLS